MIASAVQQHILQLIQERTGSSASSGQFIPVGGGSINDTYRIKTNAGDEFFCKVNSHSTFPGLFEAEKQGLEILQAQNILRIPHVIGSTVTGDTQVLVLEWIGQGIRTAGFWKLFGEQLAALHMVQDSLFGLPADNYMGALVQHNKQEDDWTRFFIRQRLEPQIKLAFDSGLLSAQEVSPFERVYVKLQEMFPVIGPSLLHGDLWSGNFLCDEEGQPVLIDPAVYYGHPAVDLAMTTLFGGFDPAFYESYNHIKTFPPNYREQWEVCNLYPLLIHLNLFGESYKSDILRTIRHY